MKITLMTYFLLTYFIINLFYLSQGLCEKATYRFRGSHIIVSRSLFNLFMNFLCSIIAI